MKNAHPVLVAVMSILTIIVIGTITASNQIAKTTVTALPQATAGGSATTFDINGVISSLVLGMPPNANTVDMATIQKFILSGDWSMTVNQGKLTNFKASFYTGPINGGTSNHTHQMNNFRVSNDSSLIHLTPDNSVSILGIVDVGTNGKKAWNDVNATIVISKGRTISINLADEDTQRHFMGQQIYGIVKKINI
jgi:hypothetical protein